MKFESPRLPRFFNRRISLSPSVVSLVKDEERPSFCSSRFVQLTVVFMFVYTLILLCSWTAHHFLPSFGLFLIVILPSLWFMFFTYLTSKAFVLFYQMLKFYFIAALTALPALFLRLGFSIIIFGSLPSGTCDLCYLTDFIISYCVDGVLFSVIKFWLIYLANDDLIIDPRSLVACSVSIGSGFSVARVIFLISTQQSLSAGWFPIYYSFDAPLNCLSSMFIGCRLADVRFYDEKQGFLTSVGPVVFFYGSFIFTVSTTVVNEDTNLYRMYMILSGVLIMLIICILLRFEFLKYAEIVPSDIRELVALGLIQHPCETCQNFVCCKRVDNSFSPSFKYETPPLSPAPNLFKCSPGLTPKKIRLAPEVREHPPSESVFGFCSFDNRSSNFMPIQGTLNQSLLINQSTTQKVGSSAPNQRTIFSQDSI